MTDYDRWLQSDPDFWFQCRIHGPINCAYRCDDCPVCEREYLEELKEGPHVSDLAEL